MAAQKPMLRFTCAFACITCDSIVELTTFQALVYGPGAFVICRVCATSYEVRRDGAHISSLPSKGSVWNGLARQKIGNR